MSTYNLPGKHQVRDIKVGGGAPRSVLAAWFLEGGSSAEVCTSIGPHHCAYSPDARRRQRLDGLDGSGLRRAIHCAMPLRLCGRAVRRGSGATRVPVRPRGPCVRGCEPWRGNGWNRLTCRHARARRGAQFQPTYRGWTLGPGRTRRDTSLLPFLSSGLVVLRSRAQCKPRSPVTETGDRAEH